MKFLSIEYGDNGHANIVKMKEDFSQSGFFINCKGNLLEWNEKFGFWQRVERGADIRCLRTYLAEEDQPKVRDSHLKAIAEYMRNLPGLTRKMNQNEMKLNLENGVLDLNLMSLEEHSKELYFDYCYRFSYHADVDIHKANAFLGFARTSMGINDVKTDKYRYLMQILGYCLSREFSGKKAVFFKGPSGTGKSRLLHVLEDIFSTYSSVPLSCLGDRFRLSLMADAHINIVHETEDGDGPVKHVDIFKKLVAGETVVTEEKGKIPQQSVIDTKLVYAVNNLPEWPVIIDKSIRNRMAVFVFPGEIDPGINDNHLLDKLLAEKDIIFSEACKALRGLRDNGYNFIPVKESKDCLDLHFSSLDSLEAFSADRCLFGPDFRIQYQSLNNAYKRYCKDNLFAKVSEVNLKKYFLSKPGVEPARFRENGANLRGLLGVGLKTGGDNNDEFGTSASAIS